MQITGGEIGLIKDTYGIVHECDSLLLTPSSSMEGTVMTMFVLYFGSSIHLH